MTTEERPASRDEAVDVVLASVPEDWATCHGEKEESRDKYLHERICVPAQQAVREAAIAAYEAGKRDERRESMAVDERDGGYETWPVMGHVQKADGSVFTYEEADALIDDFLEFWESKGMGFGGGLGVPTRAGEQR